MERDINQTKLVKKSFVVAAKMGVGLFGCSNLISSSLNFTSEELQQNLISVTKTSKSQMKNCPDA